MAEPQHPSPVLPEAPSSLSQQINTSTRSLHTQLNRQILARLPLGLPPYSTTSSKYVTGLLYVTPIYTAFEALWEELVDTSCAEKTSEGWAHVNSEKFNQPEISSSRTHSLLSSLLIPGLRRTERLRADIHTLTSTSLEEIDIQLKNISKQGNVGDFITHIEKSIKENPHVLLAYAWVLYMALFSGGRILRGVLKEAGGSGKEFWSRDPSPVRLQVKGKANRASVSEPSNFWPEQPRKPKSRSKDFYEPSGLDFFSFAGEADGEDMKLTFKKRFAESEILLTDAEKEDIVIEAQHIFRFMLGLIIDLDDVIGAAEEDIKFEEKSTRNSAIGDAMQIKKAETSFQHTYDLITSPLANVLHVKDILETISQSPGTAMPHDEKPAKQTPITSLNRPRSTNTIGPKVFTAVSLALVFLVWKTCF